MKIQVGKVIPSQYLWPVKIIPLPVGIQMAFLFARHDQAGENIVKVGEYDTFLDDASLPASGS